VLENPSGPGSAAVLARSVLVGAESTLVTGAGPGGTVLDGAPLFLSHGRLALQVPPRAPLAGARKAVAGGGAADVALHVTALIPVPVRHRVRARVAVSGRLLPWDRLTLTAADAALVGPVLDAGDEVWVLDVRHVLVEAGDDLASVTVDAWVSADPDPLTTVEAAHLQHLCSRHPEALRCLAGLLDPAITEGAGRVVPVALDSHGLVMRAEREDGHIDVRLPFTCRVASGDALRREMAGLLASAVAPPAGRPTTGR
jgi:hypothetical protein